MKPPVVNSGTTAGAGHYHAQLERWHAIEYGYSPGDFLARGGKQQAPPPPQQQQQEEGQQEGGQGPWVSAEGRGRGALFF